MIGPLDEYPLHQIASPIGEPATSDRNFYDRCYLGGHDRSGEVYLVSGLGYYPNLGVKDAFVLLRQGTSQTVVQLGDAIDGNRLDQRVNGYRIEVLEPLRRLRVTMPPTHGMALDLTWEGSFDVIQEQRHVMHTDHRVTLDACRMCQVGTWAGWITVDGERIDVDPARWIGVRDRSWGIRPIGAAEPVGRPTDPPFEGMWWVYAPLRFEQYMIVLIAQEDPDGMRSLNDCRRVWHDGRVEQLGWPQVRISYVAGTRTPMGARITCTERNGSPVIIDVDVLGSTPLHVGAGYGGDPDWGHGRWQGKGWSDRRTYDLTDAEVAGRTMFGITDHTARARCDGATGWGLFEHGALGRHDPSGFTDWFDTAAEGPD